MVNLLLTTNIRYTHRNNLQGDVVEPELQFMSPLILKKKRFTWANVLIKRSILMCIRFRLIVNTLMSSFRRRKQKHRIQYRHRGACIEIVGW